MSVFCNERHDDRIRSVVRNARPGSAVYRKRRARNQNLGLRGGATGTGCDSSRAIGQAAWRGPRLKRKCRCPIRAGGYGLCAYYSGIGTQRYSDAGNSSICCTQSSHGDSRGSCIVSGNGGWRRGQCKCCDTRIRRRRCRSAAPAATR